MGSGSLWFALAAPYSARQGWLWSIRAGLYSTATVPCAYQYLGRPTPRGLLSPMRGMDVSSLALVEIPIQLGWLGLLGRQGRALASFSLDT